MTKRSEWWSPKTVKSRMPSVMAIALAVHEVVAVAPGGETTTGEGDYLPRAYEGLGKAVLV